MKISLKLVLMLLIALGLNALSSGCYYDVEEELYPDPLASCDTTAVSYANDIVPIMQANCYNCHAAATSSSGAGIVLDNHPQMLTFVNNGRLVCTINFAAGCSPMPPSGSQISACDLALVDNWINNGAQDN